MVSKEGDKELKMEQNGAGIYTVILCVFMCTDFVLILFCVHSMSVCYVCFLSVRFMCVCPWLCKYLACVCVSGVWVGVYSHTCVFVIHRCMQC